MDSAIQGRGSRGEGPTWRPLNGSRAVGAQPGQQVEPSPHQDAQAQGKVPFSRKQASSPGRNEWPPNPPINTCTRPHPFLPKPVHSDRLGAKPWETLLGLRLEAFRRRSCLYLPPCFLGVCAHPLPLPPLTGQTVIWSLSGQDVRLDRWRSTSPLSGLTIFSTSHSPPSAITC